MTGPEHYKKAEELLASVTGVDLLADVVTATMSAAKVHGLLAMTAAIVSGNYGEMSLVEEEEWQKVLGS